MRRPWFPIRWQGRSPVRRTRRDKLIAVARSLQGRALLSRIQKKLTLRAGAGLRNGLLLGWPIRHRHHLERLVGERLAVLLETPLNDRGEQRCALVADIDCDFD